MGRRSMVPPCTRHKVCYGSEEAVAVGCVSREYSHRRRVKLGSGRVVLGGIVRGGMVVVHLGRRFILCAAMLGCSHSGGSIGWRVSIA